MRVIGTQNAQNDRTSWYAKSTKWRNFLRKKYKMAELFTQKVQNGGTFLRKMYKMAELTRTRLIMCA